MPLLIQFHHYFLLLSSFQSKQMLFNLLCCQIVQIYGDKVFQHVQLAIIISQCFKIGRLMGLDFSIAKLRAVSLGDRYSQDEYLGKVSSAELDIKSIDQLQFNAKLIGDIPKQSLVFFQRLSSIIASKRSVIQQKQRKIKEQYRSQWRTWKQCINQASFCQLQQKQLRNKTYEFFIQSKDLSEKYQDLAEKNNTEAIQMKQTAEKLFKEYKRLAEKERQMENKSTQLKTQASNLRRTLQYLKEDNDILYLYHQTLESVYKTTKNQQDYLQHPIQFQCEQFSSNLSINKTSQQGKFPFKEVPKHSSLFSDQEQSSLFYSSFSESNRPKDLKFD